LRTLPSPSPSRPELVLGRVNDSSESDSSLLAFFPGEREDSNKKSRTRVISRKEENRPYSTQKANLCTKLGRQFALLATVHNVRQSRRQKRHANLNTFLVQILVYLVTSLFFAKRDSDSSLTRTSLCLRGPKTRARPNTTFPCSTQHYPE
jgi:hypothetical protein